MPKSIIRHRSLVENQNPHHLANEQYHLVYVENAEGKLYPILLTQGDILRASARASLNPEDAPPYKLNWFEKLILKLNNLICK